MKYNKSNRVVKEARERVIKKAIELAHTPIAKDFKLYYCGILLKPNKDYVLKNNILLIKKWG